MTLKEAKRKAEEWRAEEWRGGKICSVKDCGDRWLFGFEEDASTFSALFLFVFKEDGRIECLSYARFVDLLFSDEIICEDIDLETQF